MPVPRPSGGGRLTPISFFELDVRWLKRQGALIPGGRRVVGQTVNGRFLRRGDRVRRGFRRRGDLERQTGARPAHLHGSALRRSAGLVSVLWLRPAGCDPVQRSVPLPTV